MSDAHSMREGATADASGEFEGIGTATVKHLGDCSQKHANERLKR
jgi:hypothetical protein